MQLHIQSDQSGRTSHPASQARPDPGLRIELLDTVHPERLLVERFVQTIYQRAYQARLERFYPLLLALTRDNGGYAAVAGIRPGANGHLFSEYYLDSPVDQLLHAPRARIAELGNLAPADAGQARWLICTLSAFLIGAGFSRVVFTLVPRLRNAFHRLGLPLVHLADADPERLPAGQRDDWGSYYQHRPAVYAGDIEAATPALLALMQATPELRTLATLAGATGKSLSSRHGGNVRP